jgi:hypothetical protein
LRLTRYSAVAQPIGELLPNEAHANRRRPRFVPKGFRGQVISDEADRPDWAANQRLIEPRSTPQEKPPLSFA